MSVEHLGKWDRVTSNLINQLILRTISKTVIIWELELRKIRRDYTDLFIRAIQPILWLTIFGTAFSHISQMYMPAHAILGSHGISYLAYITLGILVQSVLFISIFISI
jgi:ABC-2 type transport system permease protein